MEKLRKELPVPSTFSVWSQQRQMKINISFESQHDYEFTMQIKSPFLLYGNFCSEEAYELDSAPCSTSLNPLLVPWTES